MANNLQPGQPCCCGDTTVIYGWGGGSNQPFEFWERLLRVVITPTDPQFGYIIDELLPPGFDKQYRSWKPDGFNPMGSGPTVDIIGDRIYSLIGKGPTNNQFKVSSVELWSAPVGDRVDRKVTTNLTLRSHTGSPEQTLEAVVGIRHNPIEDKTYVFTFQEIVLDPFFQEVFIGRAYLINLQTGSCGLVGEGVCDLPWRSGTLPSTNINQSWLTFHAGTGDLYQERGAGLDKIQITTMATISGQTFPFSEMLGLDIDANGNVWSHGGTIMEYWNMNTTASTFNHIVPAIQIVYPQTFVRGQLIRPLTLA